ncbi:NACHT domain-containing protein [Streptomyces aurantiacus]|uniref:NACHT N-terminal Helical domain-containing protein n=1 Tax=Streptomyces aurantiacus TaxID=47760 RepID=A0A7G1P9F5_9ACTN|nr:hypothetical protein GCM10017557_45940 [Streptomyces aurantiacus]
MVARRLLSYRDAVVLLGGDPPALAALDRALGGALSLATGGASDTVLNLFDAQGRILRLSRDLTAGLRDSLRSVDRAERTQRLEAAHAVLVVTAYFTALEQAELPFDWAELRLTQREQISLAGGGDRLGHGFVQTLVATAAPRPAPHLPYEEMLNALVGWYRRLSDRLLDFVQGLAVWDRLSGTGQNGIVLALAECTRAAVDQYQELYARLATEVPEFGFWTGQVEHQATRWALAGVESLLTGLSAAGRPVDVAAALSSAYCAALSRPVLAEGDVPIGVCLPTLEEGYLDPHFKVRPVSGGQSGPAEEEWWSPVPVREDLTEYLAGALTTPEAADAPLVVLGQPGAGKSVLTKVLAARLPAAGFLPVRVILREVPAEAEVQDLIEYAIRAATGERATWPDLVRSAGGLTPVVLFDGFDELLQVTGVSQSDFLVRVAQFQQREADQGRPMLALVTTRTAVADRARYPSGAVALRLEPFTRPQIATWLTMWNRTNQSYFAAQGIRPLSPEATERHVDLASQPLLLLMLALYDASGNLLQRDDTPLDEAELYEDLLAAFAAREVGKSVPALPDHDLAARVEQELQRLSLVAFGMLNRRRQWVTAAELQEDLAALLGRRPAPSAEFRVPLDQAEITLGRFFFVQRAQAVRDEQRLATYEFLHATFGEYLAARLSVHLLVGLLDQRPALSVGPAAVDDDLLYVLLSYAPLSSRQMMRFVRARLQRVPPGDRARLSALLVHVLAAHTFRTEHRHADYRPDQRATSSRHGVYSANLVLLMLAVTGGFAVSDLFPDSDDPAGTWNHRALLWRSAFDEQEWTDFALSLGIRHIWRDERRDLSVGPAGTPPGSPEKVDLYWLYRYPPGHPERGRASWQRPYWDQVRYKIDVSGGTNDAVVRHALDPVFNWLGSTLTTFTGIGDEPPSSVAHDLLELWFASRLGATNEELTALYRRFDRLRGGEDHLAPLFSDLTIGNRVFLLVLELLSVDAPRLPTDLVVRLLHSATFFSSSAEGTVDKRKERVLLVCLALLTADSVLQPDTRQELTHIASMAMRPTALNSEQAAANWVKVHDSGLAGEILGDHPEELLYDDPSDLRAVSPGLLSQIRRIIEASYPHLTAELSRVWLS